MLKELVLNNRSFRRFYQNMEISEEQLTTLVDLARRTPSAANLQPIKYKLISDSKGCSEIFPHLGWAGYLKEWDGPEEGERPSAYIVMTSEVNANATIDEGIAGQTILLGAVEMGFGGCFLGNIKKQEIAEAIKLPKNMKVDYVIALGKPKEQVVLEDMKDGSVFYYRDENAVHHVPKRSLEDILL